MGEDSVIQYTMTLSSPLPLSSLPKQGFISFCLISFAGTGNFGQNLVYDHGGYAPSNDG